MSESNAPSPASSPPRDDGHGRRRRRGRQPRGRGPLPPDILYHATTRDRVAQLREQGSLQVRGGRPVYLSRDEDQAWQIAHRQADEPLVLYIDVSRARRAGCRFERSGHGRWQVRSVPLCHVLNLREGFAHQVSAGGVPVWFGPEGPEVLLIQVRRRSGVTWEVAKGKLELGETPRDAAVRELREETGYELELEIIGNLGVVRYGLFTPDGEPRLKSLYMFLMSTPTRVPVEDFEPRLSEDIVSVGWFDPEEAARLVPHRSLRPLMREVAQRLSKDERGEAEGARGAGGSEDRDGPGRA